MKPGGKILLVAATLLIAAACNKTSQSASTTSSNSGGGMVQSVTPPEQHFLNKTFSIKDYELFEVQVPAHCSQPHLHGDFRSFRYGDQGNRASDDAANIDMLLLDEQQLDGFKHGTGDSTRSVENSHEREVDWILSPSFESPKKYYLVFSNSTGKPKIKMVEANFTLSFE